MKTFKNTVSIEGLGQNPHAIFDTLHIDTLDQIGITNVTPGNGGWAVGNNGSTKNSTLIRNFGVSSGQSDWDCGQMQWSTLQQDDVSNLGSHQNVCSLTSVDVTYNFQNLSYIDSSNFHKYFLFDICVKASNDSTYLQSSQIILKYDTLAFESYIASRMSVTRGANFDIPTYIGPPAQMLFGDYNANKLQIGISINPDTTIYNRVQITTVPITLFHVKMEIGNCNQNSGIEYDSLNGFNISQYTLNPIVPYTGSEHSYNHQFFSNDLKVILCEINIISFTSPVYPGTYYEGTPTNEWLMEIQGIGFGSSIGNVYFADADTGGLQYVPLNYKDFISWNDSKIEIRMPSVIDSFPIGVPSEDFTYPTPGSGLFYVKTNTGDSVISTTPIDMPYAIKNTVDTSMPEGKIRIDLVNIYSTDSVAIIFRLDTSITNHPNPLVEAIVRKAVRDWRCEALVYFEVGSDTVFTYNTIAPDNVSLIYFTNSLSSPTTLAETQPYAGACADANGNKIVFPKEIDIAILRSPSNPWFFDSSGVALPTGMTDFYEVVLHEVGHSALLEHNTRPDSVDNPKELMFWQSLLGPISGNNRRYITLNDQDGVLLNIIPRGESLNLNTPSCNSYNIGTLIISPDQMCGTLGLSQRFIKTAIFTIYPNPMNSSFTVEFEILNNSTAQFSIYDYTGKEIKRLEKKQLQKGKYQEQIDMRQFAPGFYFFIADINSQLRTIKIVKM